MCSVLSSISLVRSSYRAMRKSILVCLLSSLGSMLMLLRLLCQRRQFVVQLRDVRGLPVQFLDNAVAETGRRVLQFVHGLQFRLRGCHGALCALDSAADVDGEVVLRDVRCHALLLVVTGVIAGMCNLLFLSLMSSASLAYVRARHYGVRARVLMACLLLFPWRRISLVVPGPSLGLMSRADFGANTFPSGGCYASRSHGSFAFSASVLAYCGG